MEVLLFLAELEVQAVVLIKKPQTAQAELVVLEMLEAILQSKVIKVEIQMEKLAVEEEVLLLLVQTIQVQLVVLVELELQIQ